MRRFIARQPRLRARGEFLGLTVTDASERPFLGHVMLHSLAWRHRRAEVGYWLVPAARGRGAGQAAVWLLVDWAFATLALDRIEITTTPDNAGCPGAGRSASASPRRASCGPKPGAREARGRRDARPSAQVTATVPV